jgi:hypothetical protein
VSLLAGKTDLADSYYARGAVVMQFVSSNFREDVTVTNQPTAWS